MYDVHAEQFNSQEIVLWSNAIYRLMWSRSPIFAIKYDMVRSLGDRGDKILLVTSSLADFSGDEISEYRYKILSTLD